MNLSATLSGLCIGANAINGSLAWGPDDLVAYAAGCLVALWYPKETPVRGVVGALRGHTGRVNCVRSLRQGEDHWFISGSADRTIRLWKVGRDSKKSPVWKCVHVLSSHEANVIAIATPGTVLDGSELCSFASCDSAGNVLLWKLSGADGEIGPLCIQRIVHKGNYPLALGIAFLQPSRACVLFTGNTDKKLHVLAQQNDLLVNAGTLTGHTDWIRSLDVLNATDGLYLASGSQDRYIRVWKIASAGGVDSAQLPSQEDNTKGSLEDADDDDEDLEVQPRSQTTLKTVTFSASKGDGSKEFNMHLETVVPAHDDWILNVTWSQRSGVNDTPLLLTASADKTLALWAPDEGASGVWTSQTKLGIAGGASSHGFTGGLIDAAGTMVLGVGHNGTIHVWQLDDGDWSVRSGVTGHYREVQSLGWGSCAGAPCLLSVSHDQTARVWTDVGADRWFEVSRPQVHGYDLSCAAFVREGTYASGAEEKVVRVFEAPQLFRETLKAVATSSTTSQNNLSISGSFVPAALPALGLSNKLTEQDDAVEGMTAEDESAQGSRSFEIPPLEESLQQQTLWPEVNKLYGHGYEIVAVGCSYDGKILATACKAAHAEHAALRIWNTATWAETQQPLHLHSLTITSVVFSHSDRFVLTASRDRSWAICRRGGDDDDSTLIEPRRKEKAHARIVWDATWSHDDTLFATGSRDKTVKIWRTDTVLQEGTDSDAIATIGTDQPVKSVDFCSKSLANAFGRPILAVGMEEGMIALYAPSSPESTAQWSCVLTVAESLSPLYAITRLRWEPSGTTEDDVKDSWRLASAGEDHSVRIFSIQCKS